MRPFPTSRASLLSVLFVLVLLSGCVEQPVEPTDDAEEEPELIIDPDRPTESYGAVVTGPAVGPDLNATTEAAPRLVTGEWWRIRFDYQLDGAPVEVVRVVADVNDEGYVFGMPHEGWFKEAIAFHSPAFGDVGHDLSYDTHNVKFEPVRFPLKVGATWETAFATTELVATVESADEHTAVIVFEPPEKDAEPTDPVMEALGLAGGASMKLTYDARVHEVVRMESFIGTWEVVEHGYDFEGWVTVPRGEHTAIDYGVLGPVSDKHTPEERTLTVEGGFNRMTLMHGVFAITPGSYSVRSVTPNGTEFKTELVGAEPFKLRFYEASDPDGTWTVQDVNIGAGVTYSMGIAYHQYDIRLPDGVRRADHSHAVIR
ncbi:MAG: hypothetical protein KY455_08795 [Euryarchaeota archaeon]|nr:hypothetical protein [Euryarchaeota archaeon]